MQKLKQFLDRLLGGDIKVLPFSSSTLPPVFSRYELAKVEQDKNNAFIALIDRQLFPTRVKQAIGHTQWATKLLQLHAVYVSPGMNRLMRFRLREKHAEFIDLSSEVYLPALGRMVRESAHTPKMVRQMPGFPAQRIVLAFLNHLLPTPITADSIRTLFGYSSVTVISALKELETQGLIYRRQLAQSRKQEIVFVHLGRALWDKASSWIKSPVGEKIALDALPDGFTKIRSGETALSDISMLNPSLQETYAFYGTAAERQSLKRHQVVLDDGKYVIEFWKHPVLLPGMKKLDPLSTILATRNIANDDRVAGEQDEILEKFKW